MAPPIAPPRPPDAESCTQAAQAGGLPTSLAFYTPHVDE